MKLFICLIFISTLSHADWTEKDKTEFKAAKAAHELALKNGDKEAIKREALFKKYSDQAKVQSDKDIDSIFKESRPKMNASAIAPATTKVCYKIVEVDGVETLDCY